MIFCESYEQQVRENTLQEVVSCFVLFLLLSNSVKTVWVKVHFIEHSRYKIILIH